MTLERILVDIKQVAMMEDWPDDEIEDWGFTRQEVDQAVEMVKFYEDTESTS